MFNRDLYQQEKSDKYHSVKRMNTIQCLICKRWYRQVGSHVTQRHQMTCREYREMFDLERKSGLLPPDLKKLKADQCRKNGTIKNLEAGKNFRFIKGDKRAGDYKRSSITLKRVSDLGKSRARKKKIV